MIINKNPAEIVMAFLKEVRSGKKPENAVKYLAANVTAHQIDSESPVAIVRTPAEYTQHIHDFLEIYGNFDFEITEFITQSNKVYARWKQTGHHLREIEGFSPTGKQLVQFASAVYRVDNGLIVEYWIQIDRLGILIQLQEI